MSSQQNGLGSLIERNSIETQQIVPAGESHPQQSHLAETQTQQISPLKLKLINKKLPIRYCEFKISNSTNKMTKSDTQAISPSGIQFVSAYVFDPGCLLRIWIEVPDYWARKSRHVGYRHTEAPTWFQMLARVLTCEELNKRGSKFQLLCESVNLDPADEKVLKDFLGCGD